MSDTEAPTRATRADLWNDLSGFNSGMLRCGKAEFVPMSHNLDDERQHVWFITAAGTDIAEACRSFEQPAIFVIASEGDRYFLRLQGSCVVVQDRAKLEELWNPVADAWFEDGQDDPDVRLVRFTPTAAEGWKTTGAVGFAVQIARNKLTGATPDMGEHLVYAL